MPTKYFIIIPDGIGHGKSSKPSDGLKTKFPKYNYEDMVDAQYRLLTEGLGIKHLRLVIGNSMGGMHTWIWGEKYPEFMDALVPMASQPTAMAARNWMLRRMMLETIRNDPEYNDGNYTSAAADDEIRHRVLSASRPAAARSPIRSWRRRATRPTRWSTSGSRRRSRPTPTISSTSGNPRTTTIPPPGLEKIEAALLAINAADDERNPPETGVTEAAVKRVKNGRLYLIPASDDTRGHGTTGTAKFYKQQLQDLLQAAPQKTM